MQIILNGKPYRLEHVATVAELLTELELKGRLAVEVNRRIVPRSLFHEQKLAAGDNVEIVNAIGGG